MKVILVMLTTLNGKIAQDHSDRLEWGGKADKEHFAKLTKQIGTVIMGSSNFEALRHKVLPGRKNIVMTSKPEKYAHIKHPDLTITTEQPGELIKRLAQSGLKEVALIGGGTLNSSFLKAGLIDEIYLSLAPVIFTQGIDLFADIDEQLVADYKLVEIKPLDERTVCLHYQVDN